MSGRRNRESSDGRGQAALGGGGDPATVLRLGDPASVLRAIDTGDPLGLLERCARRARERALLVDVDRLQQQAAAHVAVLAGSYDAGVELDQWLSMRIDDAIERILQDDHSEASRFDDTTDQWDPRYEFLVYTLGVDPRRTRRACVAFNALPVKARRAFFALVLDGRDPDDCVGDEFGSSDEIIDGARAGLLAIIAPDDGGAH